MQLHSNAHEATVFVFDNWIIGQHDVLVSVGPALTLAIRLSVEVEEVDLRQSPPEHSDANPATPGLTSVLLFALLSLAPYERLI